MLKRKERKLIVVHVLKLSKLFATEVFNGVKSFELRKNDRNYQVGDFVHFVDINKQEFLNGEVLNDFDNGNLFKITYILSKTEFIDVPKDYVVMSIVRVDI